MPDDYYVSRYSGEEIDDLLGKANAAVRYDAAQSLTPTQQHTAQKNIGVAWPCNPNLLDNWYFGNPVNQRGGTEYSPTWNGYSIDRWSVEADSDLSIKIVDGGITVKNNASTQRQLKQILDNDTTLEGNLCTVSCLVSSINGNAAISYSQVQNPYKNSIGFVYLSAGLCIGSGTRFDAQHKIVITLDPGAEVTIQAVKLELGPTQTLAHKEGDNWVLNEIPDYGEQLRRCQRYFYRLTRSGNYSFVAPFGTNGAGTSGAFNIPMPSMRTSPTIANGSGTLFVRCSGGVGTVSLDATSLRIGGLFEGGGCIFFATSDFGGASYGVCIADSISIDFSADL